MASLLNHDVELVNKASLRSPPVEYPADDGFWSNLAKRAKSVLLEDGSAVNSSWETKDLKRLPEECSPNSQIYQGRLSGDGRWKCQDTLDLHKGLQAIASSLSLLSDTLGTAIEEGLNLVETRKEFLRPPMKIISATPSPDQLQAIPVEEKMGLTKETQLKAAHDVAMSMTTKAKLLLRELKCVKADLTFTKDRCAQLEEENKRLRDSLDKGLRHEEDDLVRLQLETLLAEKARLAQENASYARENQFLHEVVQYHQLTLRDVVLLDDSLIDAADFGMDAPMESIEFLEEEHPHEKDIPVLEDSPKKAS